MQPQGSHTQDLDADTGLIEPSVPILVPSILAGPVHLVVTTTSAAGCNQHNIGSLLTSEDKRHMAQVVTTMATDGDKSHSIGSLLTSEDKRHRAQRNQGSHTQDLDVDTGLIEPSVSILVPSILAGPGHPAVITTTEVGKQQQEQDEASTPATARGEDGETNVKEGERMTRGQETKRNKEGRERSGKKGSGQS